jgi:hypothetical protein
MCLSDNFEVALVTKIVEVCQYVLTVHLSHTLKWRLYFPVFYLNPLSGFETKRAAGETWPTNYPFISHS